MRKFIGAASALALLSGCAALGLTGSPANDLPIVSQDILKTVNVACAEYAPIGALAVVIPDPKVQAIALTTTGVCDLATGQVIPGVASKLDASSAAWVGLSVGMLKALGVAPVAVPAAPAPAATKTSEFLGIPSLPRKLSEAMFICNHRLADTAAGAARRWEKGFESCAVVQSEWDATRRAQDDWVRQEEQRQLRDDLEGLRSFGQL